MFVTMAITFRSTRDSPYMSYITIHDSLYTDKNNIQQTCIHRESTHRSGSAKPVSRTNPWQST
jgi:hypothetical protein